MLTWSLGFEVTRMLENGNGKKSHKVRTYQLPPISDNTGF